MSEINQKLAKRIVKAAKESAKQSGDLISYEQVLELLRNSGVEELKDKDHEERNIRSYFPDIPKNYTLPPKTQTNWNRVPLGLQGEDKQLMQWDFTKDRLLSIGGLPGSGKTTMLSNIQDWLSQSPTTEVYYLDFESTMFPMGKKSLGALRDSLEKCMKNSGQKIVVLISHAHFPPNNTHQRDFIIELVRLLDYYPNLSLAIESSSCIGIVKERADIFIICRGIRWIKQSTSPMAEEAMFQLVDDIESNVHIDALNFQLPLGSTFFVRMMRNGQLEIARPNTMTAFPLQGESLDNLTPQFSNISTYLIEPTREETSEPDTEKLSPDKLKALLKLLETMEG